MSTADGRAPLESGQFKMKQTSKPKILVVDDDEQVRKAVERVLGDGGFLVDTATSSHDALAQIDAGAEYATVVCDLAMPGLGGLELMKLVRERDSDLPVIVLTGQASLESAMEAMQYGGFRYLTKPFDPEVILDAVRSASAVRHLELLRRRALEVCDSGAWPVHEAESLDANFEAALKNLWMAFQPIVDFSSQTIYGYEALVRSDGPELTNPGLLFDAAERLGRVRDVGREVRRLVALRMNDAPAGGSIFVNLHALDLGDDDLYAASAPLSKVADRVVLEITERMSLDRISDLRERIQALRKLGYRIAVDDLGSGYAGLTSFSQLEPDVAKMDMALIRDVDSNPRKASIVSSMLTVCRRDLDTRVVCEGVETRAEVDALQKLGADLLQGYYFARPKPKFSLDSVFPEESLEQQG